MPRPVVAAAIVDSLERPTELLACSRAYPQELRGQFELPGGKIEEGEDPVAALEREIAEELGARLIIGGPAHRRGRGRPLRPVTCCEAGELAAEAGGRSRWERGLGAGGRTGARELCRAR